MAAPRKTVLFICRHNSARSQMAEGFLNSLARDRYEASSAGIEPGQVNPLAVEAMSELGIDISHHFSKSVKDFLEKEIDYVVTVCDQAKEACPFFPGAAKRIHRGFEDPSRVVGSDEEKLTAFRRARDEITSWVEDTFLAGEGGGSGGYSPSLSDG